MKKTLILEQKIMQAKMKGRPQQEIESNVTKGVKRGKRFSPFGISGSLKISEENGFREENPSRGASVTRQRHFRKQIREYFPPSFVCSSLFFGLQLVSSRNRTFQFILCALTGPHLFRVLLSLNILSFLYLIFYLLF